MFKKRWCVLTLIGLLGIAGCTPQPPLPPVESATSPKPAPTVTQSLAATVSAEDAAWAKVVQDGQKEGMVTFYSVTYSGEDAQVLGDAFKRKYGITVEFIVGQGSTNMERLRTEKRMHQMTGDVVQGALGHLFNAKQTGIIKSVADLPSIKNKALWEVDPLVLDPAGFVPALEGMWNGPVINTRLVPEGSEPKSLKDLLKPEWKGKVLFLSPLTTSTVIQYYLGFINKGIIDWSYVEALGKQVGGYARSPIDEARMLARGEYPIANSNSSSSTVQTLLEGAPLRLLSMEEGDYYNLSGIALVEGGPHPNAAKVFMNWMFSKEAALVKAEKTKMNGNESMLKGVPPAIPEQLIPRMKKRIVVTQKDVEDSARLFAEGYVSKLLKLQ